MDGNDADLFSSSSAAHVMGDLDMLPGLAEWDFLGAAFTTSHPPHASHPDATTSAPRTYGYAHDAFNPLGLDGPVPGSRAWTTMEVASQTHAAPAGGAAWGDVPITLSSFVAALGGSTAQTQTQAQLASERVSAFGAAHARTSAGAATTTGGLGFDIGLPMDSDADGGDGASESSDGDVAASGDASASADGRVRSVSASRGATADEKRAKRLERNRESARQSRRRKKQYLDLLETRVAELHRQIAALRAEHCAAADATLNAQRSELLRRVLPVAVSASRGVDEDATLADAAAQLIDRFGPNCAERRAVRDFHFDQLQRLLLPPHTKFLLWLVHQPPEVFTHTHVRASASTDALKDVQSAGTSLWTLLCTEIGLSNDQSEKLRASLRRVIGGPETPRETWRLGVASAYLGRLRSALSARAAAAQAQLEALRGILTSAQLIRYLAWMETHSADIIETVDVTISKTATGNA